MSSMISFLNNLTSDPLLVTVIVLGIVVIVLLIIVILMQRKLSRFLVDTDAEHIGDSLERVTGELADLKTFKGDLESYLTTVEKRLRKSIQSVHTVRFNPWHGSGEGGNQSFATAFMDQDGDGVVISSLYSRDHVSVFGKPLKKRESAHELSEEEKKAVDEAAKGVE